MRFNDGACDSKGRFFAGTIFNKERGIAGKLYKYDPADDRCSVVDDGPFTVQSNFWQQWRWADDPQDSNGLGWSPDEKILSALSAKPMLWWLKKKDSYFTDSLTNKIYAYDYNNGELSNRRIFIDAIAQGLPENTFCDGLCVDDEGCVWSARFVLGLFSAEIILFL